MKFNLRDFYLYLSLFSLILFSSCVENVSDANNNTNVNPTYNYNLRIEKLGDGTAVNLSWNLANAVVSSFEIHRKIGFKGTYSLYKTVPGDVKAIVDVNLNKDSTYYYKIRGINQGVPLPFSQEVNSDNLFSSGDLEPPTNLVANARGTRLVILNWRDNSTNEIFFTIERKNEWGDFVRIASVLKDVTTFRDTTYGLFPGGTFSYRIKAFSGKDSAHSNIATTTTYAFDLPAPSNLRGNYDRNRRIVNLEWVNNDTQGLIKFFAIERRVIDSSNYTTLNTIPFSQLAFVDSTTQLNKVYFYRVAGLNNNRQYSEYSNEIAISTY
ncbi:MAG: hypothetical protein N2043_13125 [Ignavibacterium sp.]|nr:hypothetical protein [Ignavibacterium sp.]